MWRAVTHPAIITLRTIAPPFVLEGTCIFMIFIAAFFLALPLASHINMQIFGGSSKSKNNLTGIKLEETPSATNYPSFPAPLPSAIRELPAIDLPIYLEPVKRSSEEFGPEETGRNSISGLLEVTENVGSKIRQVFDECSLVSYNSYRHKLIEETLQKQYGGGYAPGNVILNLIALNTADSTTSVMLAKKYNRSFFDHIKTSDGIGAVVGLSKSRSRSEVADYPDQLAHFIPRNLRKPSTTEIDTETAQVSEISVVADPSSATAATTRPNTPTSCQRIICKRSRETRSGVNHNAKSPFSTPVNSQAPLNARGSLSQRMRDQRSNPTSKDAVNQPQNVACLQNETPVLTEQLYRRNDASPDVVSRTHVDTEEYLNRIARNMRYETTIGQRVNEPRIRSSLKKSLRQQQQPNRGNKSGLHSNMGEMVNERVIDCSNVQRSVRGGIRRLTTSKPAIWNNSL